MSILLLLLGLGILWWVSNINNRLNALEAAVKPPAPTLVGVHQEETAKPIEVAVSEPIVQATTPVYTAPTEVIRENSAESPFATWLKTDWQIKLGALLLLISFGWFARYAFMNNWIGPVGRISLGIIAGMAIAAFGTLRLKTHRTQGEIFLVLGSSIVLVTIFAARYYYQMFSPLVALFAMFLASAYVAVISAKEKNTLLAFSGLILGGLAPLFTVSSGLDPSILFTYLLAVTLGSIWLAYFHERREIISSGLGVYTFYSLMHLDITVFNRENTMMLAFFFVFAALFAAANITNHIKTKSGGHFSDILVALINNTLVLVWIMSLASEPLNSILLLAWAALFAGCAFASRIFGNTKELWAIYYGSAITLLAVATAEQFGGNTLVVAFTLEVLAIIAATHAIKKDFVVTRRMTWLLIVPIFMSLDTIMSVRWQSDNVLPLVGTLGIIAASCIGLGFVLRYLSDKTNEAKLTVSTLFTVGITYLYVILERLLNGNTLIAAFTVMGLAVIAATHVIKKDFTTTRRLAWLLLLPAIMSVNTIFSSQWQNGKLLPLVTTLGVIAAACFVLASVYKNISDATDEAHVTITALNIVGSAYLYVILWRVSHVWLTADMATMTSLIVYTVVGLATNLYGQLHKHKTLRLYGGVLLGLVVARLLIVDIWEMAIPGRIVTFFLIGTLLMSTAFIGRNGAKFIEKT